MHQALPGNKAAWVGCVAQNAQCAICVASLPASASTGLTSLTSLMPATLQISVQTSPLTADMACDTDGASEANSIAIHTIHAAQRRVIELIPIMTL